MKDSGHSSDGNLLYLAQATLINILFDSIAHDSTKTVCQVYQIYNINQQICKFQCTSTVLKYQATYRFTAAEYNSMEVN